MIGMYHIQSQHKILWSQELSNTKIQIDYYTFLQQLDEEMIIVKENGFPIQYYKKYFLKNYMVEKLRKIQETESISIFGEKSQFLFDNYPEISIQLWNLKNQTTRAVVQRIDELNQMSQQLLILSIICILIAIIIYMTILISIIQWRNQLFQHCSYLKIFKLKQINYLIINNKVFKTSGTKQDDEEKNKKIKLIWQFYGVLTFFLLLIISLGFYIPLFLYIDSVNLQSIVVNQLQTVLAMMQLKQSIIFTCLAINQTENKYNNDLIHNKSIFQYVIDECTPLEYFVLYELSFDCKYDYFPEIQLYSSISLRLLLIEKLIEEWVLWILILRLITFIRLRIIKRNYACLLNCF